MELMEESMEGKQLWFLGIDRRAAAAQTARDGGNDGLWRKWELEGPCYGIEEGSCPA